MKGAHREESFAQVIGVRPLEAFVIACALLCVVVVFTFLIMWTANSTSCGTITVPSSTPSPRPLPATTAR